MADVKKRIRELEEVATANGFAAIDMNGWSSAKKIAVSKFLQQISYNAQTGVLSLSNGGGSVQLDVGGLQVLSYEPVTNMLSLSGGGSVALRSDLQSLSYGAAQRRLTLSNGGNTVQLSNDLQILSYDDASRTLTLSGGGGSVVLSGGGGGASEMFLQEKNGLEVVLTDFETIRVKKGSARDSTNSYDIILEHQIIKTIYPFNEGNEVGCLSSASVNSMNCDAYVFLIASSEPAMGKQPDILIHINADPTNVMPVGFDIFRQIDLLRFTNGYTNFDYQHSQISDFKGLGDDIMMGDFKITTPDPGDLFTTSYAILNKLNNATVTFEKKVFAYISAGGTQWLNRLFTETHLNKRGILQTGKINNTFYYLYFIYNQETTASWLYLSENDEDTFVPPSTGHDETFAFRKIGQAYYNEEWMLWSCNNKLFYDSVYAADMVALSGESLSIEKPSHTVPGMMPYQAGSTKENKNFIFAKVYNGGGNFTGGDFFYTVNFLHDDEVEAANYTIRIYYQILRNGIIVADQNLYTDIIIEILNANGLEVVSANSEVVKLSQRLKAGDVIQSYVKFKDVSYDGMVSIINCSINYIK